MNALPPILPDPETERTHEVLSRGIFSRGGMVLLCRGVGKPHSYLPGGHIDPGEGARTALVRELGEELGATGRTGAFLGMSEHFFRDASAPGGMTYELTALFLLTDLTVEGVMLSPEAGAPRSREAWNEFFWCGADAASLAAAGFEPACLREALAQWICNPGNGHFASSYLFNEREKVS